MATLLQLYQGQKSFGSREIFRNAGFSIETGEHVGVIGPNGAGKTTLFKILAGIDELDSGEISKTARLRIGYLAQHDNWSPDETVESYLSRDCVTPIWDLKSLGRGLGLREEDYGKTLASLSGGYRMRCKLLHLLGEEPDLLLLDEPTNYLDLESLLVLERFLQDYRGSFMLISHDREFLRRTTDHILEVEGGEITKYNGTIDDYFEQKALLRAQLEARAMSIEDKRKTVLDFVARFGAKATKARQAQSRLKSLDRLEKIEIKALPSAAQVRIPSPTPTGKQVLEVKEADLGYGDRVVLRNISFSLNRGDHLAVVGVNGAGKSTFLKALAGRLDPLRGRVNHGYQVSIGYYAQHVAEALNPNLTVVQAMSAKAHIDVLPQQVLDLAGSLLFSGTDVQKKVSVLSGGEKSRVALGQILLQRSPCLLLDEPTNHLDFQTVEALTQSLQAYEGTVVVVSHDRSFISRIGTKVLEIHDGRVDYYPGTYDEYVWSCQKGGLASNKVSSPTESSANATSMERNAPSGSVAEKKFNFKEEKKLLERDVRKAEREQGELEKKIASSQERMKILNHELATQSGHVDAVKWVKELGELQRAVEQAEGRWLELGELRESLAAKIAGLLE